MGLLSRPTLAGALTITQSPASNNVLFLGSNGLVILVMDASSNTAYSTNTVVVRDQTPPLIPP